MNASVCEPAAESVSLARLEAAINAWRDAQAPVTIDDEAYVLNPQSGCLAEIYGAMIYRGWDSVPLASLTQDQRDALLVAEA